MREVRTQVAVKLYLLLDFMLLTFVDMLLRPSVYTLIYCNQ